jgi:hypothetical protein
MFTFDYIDSLAECWSREKLAEAAKLWPHDANWAWFCGARLQEHDPKRQIEVLSIGIAHAMKQRYSLKRRPGEFFEWAKKADGADRLRAMADFGAELDALDAAARAAEQAATAAESE